MADHTPLPWRVEDSREEGGILEIAVGHQSIAEVAPYSERFNNGAGADEIDEGIANAEFIVRAVNSHDALVAVARRVVERGSCDTDPADCVSGSGPLCERHDWTLDGDVVQAAKDAIAKAEGRE